VIARTGIYGHKPYARVTHIAYIIEFGSYSVEVAVPVPVGIAERVNENFVIVVVLVFDYVLF